MKLLNVTLKLLLESVHTGSGTLRTVGSAPGPSPGLAFSFYLAQTQAAELMLVSEEAITRMNNSKLTAVSGLVRR